MNARQVQHLSLVRLGLIAVQGTWQFLSIRLLRDTQAYHQVSDDIESFIWILLWVATRYAPNNLSFAARAAFLQRFDRYGLIPDFDKASMAGTGMVGITSFAGPQLKSLQLEALLGELMEQLRYRYDDSKRYRTPGMSDDDVKKLQERLSTHEWMESTLLRELDNEEWRGMKDGAVNHPVAQNTGGISQLTKKRTTEISECQEERANKRMREASEDEDEDDTATFNTLFTAWELQSDEE